MSESKKIILASASPRRREILQKTGIEFEVCESDYEEDMDLDLRPDELARFLSREKARSVAPMHRDAIIISADTIVVLKDRIFGKPVDAEDAACMLRTLSGRSHTVITGYTVMDAGTGREISASVETRVVFKRLTDEEIDAYIRSGEPMDKAGAYGVQGLGAVIVKRIEGDFFNVMGLPLNSLAETLGKFGIRLL